MGAQSHPVATYRGMFIHHLFLDALHTTSQTVSRQQETVTAIVTRPLQNDVRVSVHGQQSGRPPGRQFRARVGHLRSLCHQLFVNDQGKGTAPTLRPLLRLPFLYKPHPPRPTLRKLAATSIVCHDPPRLIVHSMGPSFYISTLLLLLESHLGSD
jgi:hypothetical protein